MSEEHFRRYGWTYGPHNNTVTHRYAEAAIQVAKDLDIPYIDMWTAIEKRVQESRKQRPVEPCEDNGYDGYDEFLSDGLHLNAKGNLLLFRTLAGTIERNWPELCPHGRSVVA
ncbi:isoamyl acetate-hydrolyzing esterase [Coemansia sp. IMI 209127]|nr:isoamyl acetate-hydrolyzing esterase [Coemansia sp. IMI 209127]KAJ1886697.1 isoamyl acetate-hydrolyzing esterase [Coemansia sp. IMI 209127]